MKSRVYLETSVVSYLTALPIETMCRAAGLQPPLICTPEELLEE